MRRYLGSLVSAGVAVLTFPVYAAAASTDPPQVSAAMAARHVTPLSAPVSDEAAMMAVGTALIGLAAAVRRAA